MSKTILIDHVGVIVTISQHGRFYGPDTLLADEEFSEPWKCEQVHEHTGYCGIDRQFVIPRYYKLDVATDVYLEELLPLDQMQAAQLTRRYEEVEAKWLELGTTLEAMRVEIERRKQLS